ncbi:zinc finger BED domain-containing protein RICESLEEPER 2-like protein [Tanacetum coccineum]
MRIGGRRESYVCKPYLEKKSKSQTHITFEGGDVNKMMAWKFDQNKSKRDLAHMIVIDELPFSFVKNSGFRHFQRINQPLFDIPCRDIGKGVESCLNEWGFDNVLSISVDNASANDSAIDFMKMILEKNYNCLLKGKWMHIRCAAHVINLIVQDGMKKVDNSIEGIRCAVKWIKKSGTRIEKFTKCAQSARCDSTKSLILDCPTRWNSTYAMLEVAHVYEDAFARYDLEDVDFGTHIRSKGHSVPTSNDWTKAKKLCHFLKSFYEITFPGQNYVRIHAPSSTTSSTLGKRQRTTDTSNEPDHGDMLRRRMKMGQSSNSSISELDKYVGEVCEPFDKSVHFDILQWWKVNSQIFPILSLMARDLLAIAISTVASESIFSTSGQVLDSYRSSLGDKTIECLICTQDWLRVGLNPEKEEGMDTIAQIKKGKIEEWCLKFEARWIKFED